ncbi:MAG: phosphate ABC transporter permease PstA [Deltaproteobacteria bacterium]|nr:phosphate ABC transporter permease PstA [Deltaproteobacteria bacterium]
MRERSIRTRKWTDGAVRFISMLAALTGIAFLGWILWVVLARGVRVINWEFLTALPTPPGVPGGGLGNAIAGTAAMTILATVIGVPVGMLAGIFLSEFGRQSRIATVVRFSSNILMGTPSIIIGVFIYVVMVLPAGHFSGYAGAVSLAVIMLPVVSRTTEDMLLLVPNAVRESALALGAPRWKATLGVVLGAAKTGLVTGSLLAIARVTGETAPLLFTALNSPYWSGSLNGPTGNLTVTIFNYAMSPYADWQAQAWGAAFLIVAGVLGTTIISRVFLALRGNGK